MREAYTHAILIMIISYIITLLVIITLMIIRDNYFPIFDTGRIVYYPIL